MGWKEQYRQASFRNVPFFVRRAESEFGRDVVTHEFPLRETPFVEDMGRKTRRFNIEGYLVGDDYFIQRDNLIAACELDGEGKLIHPYYGTLTVNCDSIRFTDSDRDLRMVQFRATFIEQGEVEFPRRVINTERQLSDAKSVELTNLQTAFQEVYDISQLPVNKVQELRENINTGIELIRDQKAVANSSDDFRRQVEGALADINVLLNNGEELALTIINLITFGTFADDEDDPATSENSRQQFNEMLEILSGVNDIGATSSVAVLFNDLLYQTTVTTASGFVSLIPYDSYDDAINIQNTVLSITGTEMLKPEIDDIVYEGLKDLRTFVIEEIESLASDLARLSSITLPEAHPALLLSYELYGTTDEEQDIIDRNQVQHPAFVPGGVPIEVLTDVS